MNPSLVSKGHFVHGDNIFRIVVIYFQQIIYFTFGVFRQLAAYLNIYPLVSADTDKIYFLCAIFSDIGLITASAHFKIDDVF